MRLTDGVCCMYIRLMLIFLASKQLQLTGGVAEGIGSLLAARLCLPQNPACVLPNTLYFSDFL